MQVHNMILNVKQLSESAILILRHAFAYLTVKVPFQECLLLKCAFSQNLQSLRFRIPKHKNFISMYISEFILSNLFVIKIIYLHILYCDRNSENSHKIRVLVSVVVSNLIHNIPSQKYCF